ncbi:MAG: alpha/beta hydrolase family protein [Candidatus Saccharibacteria bacterium]
MNRLPPYPLRTSFGEIIAEFYPPVRHTRRVIVLCGGMPGYPRRTELMKMLALKGFWVFNPRYRGTWESGGLMFRKPVEKDITDILDALPKGFTDLWSGKVFRLRPSQIALWGSSFGGAAVLLAGIDRRVNKVIAVSPLVDWLDDSDDKPLDKFIPYLKKAFGLGYRIDRKGWDRIRSGKFMSPVRQAKKMDGRKVLIIHAKDDRTCPYRSTEKFARLIGAKLVTYKKGGHGLSYTGTVNLKRIINRFLKQ